jgi:hypothetical protein
LGDNGGDRGRRLLSNAKEIKPSRRIRNKDRAEFSTGRDHGAGVCLFVKQRYQRLADSCQAKYQMQNIEKKEALAFAKASP